MLDIFATNTNYTHTQGQMADAELSVHHPTISNISNSSTCDDRSNSPRAVTPERGGHEEKEKRKKKVK